MNRKKFNEQVLQVRRAIIQAIPPGVSFAAIIIALAQLIERYQELALEEESEAEDNRE